MSSTADPNPASPPPAPTPPAPAPFRRASCSGCLLGLSLVGNLAAFVVVALFCLYQFSLRDQPTGPRETFHSGDRKASTKVAIVSVDGIIIEGLVSSVQKEIDQAARDDKVKAVVLRVNSPGGSVSASEDLYRRLVRLRDGDPARDRPAKPIVTSMGSLAASGGYYIAVPARTIFAEPSTQTGSIGVYASLPNVHKFTSEHGLDMVTVRAGEIKTAGSPFKAFTPRDREVYQDMVNEMYSQFLDVVSTNRKPLTRARLLDRFTVQPVRPDPRDPEQPPAKPFMRYRADGGVYFAPRAKELGLVDSLGDLDDAVKAAAELAELGDSYKAVQYEKPWSLLGQFTGQQQGLAPSAGVLEPDRLQNALSPRMWYLAPGHEAAALAAGARAARSNP